MTPRYIVFKNDADQAHAVVSLGTITHAQLWRYLHQKNPLVFARPVGAGRVTYRVKHKRFITDEASSTLSLVSHEDDGQIVQAIFSDNPKLRLIVSDFGVGFPDFSFLLGSSDVLKSEYFTGNKICGIDRATFRIHDSKQPIKFGTDNLPKDVDPVYVAYMEERLVA